ncbi:MAG: hypothetical protein AB1422_05525 [bacterium]
MNEERPVRKGMGLSFLFDNRSAILFSFFVTIHHEEHEGHEMEFNVL